MKKQILGSTKRKRSPQEGEVPAQVLDMDATCWVPTQGSWRRAKSPGSAGNRMRSLWSPWQELRGNKSCRKLKPHSWLGRMLNLVPVSCWWPARDIPEQNSQSCFSFETVFCCGCSTAWTSDIFVYLGTFITLDVILEVLCWKTEWWFGLVKCCQTILAVLTSLLWRHPSLPLWGICKDWAAPSFQFMGDHLLPVFRGKSHSCSMVGCTVECGEAKATAPE